MPHLVAIGACYLDTILSVPHYPFEDEKLRASSLIRRRGGNCPNTLEVLQQLVELKDNTPISILLCAVLPSTSSAGTNLIQSSFGPQVDLSYCIYREAFTEPASSYIIKSLLADTRMIVNYNSLPEMTYEEFRTMADAIGNTVSWYHFEGRIPDITLECIKYLRHSFSDIKVSVEVEKPNRAGLQDLAAEADVVFYSKSWAEGSGYTSPEKFLRYQSSLTPKALLLCCTWGQSGSSALRPVDMTYLHSPAYSLKGHHVVEYTPPAILQYTIGAGDTFIAGMLYCLLYHHDDWTLHRKLAFANELAGRKVVQEGFSSLACQMQQL